MGFHLGYFHWSTKVKGDGGVALLLGGAHLGNFHEKYQNLGGTHLGNYHEKYQKLTL